MLNKTADTIVHTDLFLARMKELRNSQEAKGQYDLQFFVFKFFRNPFSSL